MDVLTPITTKQYTATPIFDKAAANCGGAHTNAATHDKSISYSWAITPELAGVSINSSGLLTIDRTKLAVGNHNINIKATATVGGVTVRSTVGGEQATGIAPLTIGNSYSCTYTMASFNIVNPTTTINADATTSAQYNAQVTYSAENCNQPDHLTGNKHVVVTWEVAPVGTNSLNGIAINPTTGLLTIDKKLMPNVQTVVAVTAKASGATTTPVHVTITKTLNCDKVLSTAAGSFGSITPNSAKVVSERNRVVFPVKDATGTLEFTLGANKPVFTGTCAYEGTPQAASCPNLAKHTVTWSLEGTPPAGIKLDPTSATTGLLTVNRDALVAVQTSIKIIATMNGQSTYGYIVVNKGAYNPNNNNDDDDDHDYEQERKDEQFNKIEDKIEDADRKDTIRENLSDNPNFPARIMRELRGKDVNLELYMGNGFTWKINGKNLNSIPSYQIYIPLDVKRISDSDISKKAKERDIKIIELGHNGSFYGTYNLQMSLSTDYAKKTVYLYKYLENSSKLSYKGAAKADSDGYVTFPFTSASTYVVTDRPLYGETVNTVPSGGGNTGGTTGGSTATVTPTPKPPVSSSTPPASSSSSSSSQTSSESSSLPAEVTSSSSEEPSKPTDIEPEEEEKPEKKKSSIPIIVPILIVVVTITVIAVVLLAKGGGMDVG